MRILLRWAACGLAAASATHALAQTPPPDFRSQIASARLGAGYAQMINMSATPDLSAASYRVDAMDPHADIDVLHLPYQAKWLTLSPDADLDWRIAAGWLQFKQTFPVQLASPGDGSIGSKWSAYSIGAGLAVDYRLGRGFTLMPALDLGIARLTNSASYDGAANALKPFLDGLLFDWNANAWLAPPSVALEWKGPAAGGTATVRGHVARSWIGSFDETDPVQHFNEAVNIWSARAEYSHPTPYQAFDRNVSWVAYARYTGFFGANRDVFGFDAVTEVGGGFELPIVAAKPGAERVRLSGSYLFGPGVRGWTVGVSLEY